jgi:ribonuclease HI
MDKVKIYVAGYSQNNCGSGGFGVVALKGNKVVFNQYMYDGQKTKTNEEILKSIIFAFELVEKSFKSCECTIYCDSAYILNLCEIFIYEWSKNDWKTSSGKEVKNLVLVQSLYNYLTTNFLKCQIKAPKTQSDNLGIEMAKALAQGHKNRFQCIAETAFVLPRKNRI